MKLAPRLSRRGFTVAEVIIALAIAFLALGVLTQAFVNALNALPQSRPHRQIQADALHWVRAQILKAEDRDALEDGGEVEAPTLGEVQWEAEIEDAELPDLFHVTLTYRWRPEGEVKEQEQTETILVYQKNWSDPTDRGRVLEDAQDAIERISDERDW